MKRGKTQVQFGLRKINRRCKERFKECHVSNKQLVTGVSSEVASVVHFVQNVFLHGEQVFHATGVQTTHAFCILAKTSSRMTEASCPR